MCFSSSSEFQFRIEQKVAPIFARFLIAKGTDREHNVKVIKPSGGLSPNIFQAGRD